MPRRTESAFWSHKTKKMKNKIIKIAQQLKTWLNNAKNNKKAKPFISKKKKEEN